jgi:hypothetical protein
MKQKKWPKERRREGRRRKEEEGGYSQELASFNTGTSRQSIQLVPHWTLWWVGWSRSSCKDKMAPEKER